MPRGKVRWFDEIRGCGLIRQDRGPEVLVHYSAIRGEGFRTLEEGQEVEFEIRETCRGPEAVRVFRVE